MKIAKNLQKSLDVGVRKNMQFYLETYGCQMNIVDSEIIKNRLKEHGFTETTNPLKASIILANTCAVREKAENRIYSRAQILKAQNPNAKIGILGCIAEYKSEQLLKTKYIDFVLGPNNYRDIGAIISNVEGTSTGNVCMTGFKNSETYSDIVDDILMENTDKVSVRSYTSIMRGCNNFCSYCIVPYTRGREESLPQDNIYQQISLQILGGAKDITLLGQNVNSYKGEGINFPELIETLAHTYSECRFRFLTSNPKDFTHQLIQVIKGSPNICKHIHLPLQSGSTSCLQRMNRSYTSQQYIKLIRDIRDSIPHAAITTDIICGFSGETDSQFEDTLRVLRELQFDSAYTFMYSHRPHPLNTRIIPDDVTLQVKKRRLADLIHVVNQCTLENQKMEIGRRHLVLVESMSSKGDAMWKGRTDTGKTVLLPKDEVEGKKVEIGNFLEVKIENSNLKSLFGVALRHSSITQYGYQNIPAI